MKTTLPLIVSVLPLAATDLFAATLYVSPVSQNPTTPYASWTTAATNIQDAVDAAVAGDEIVVTNGLYATGGRTPATGSTQTSRVALDKAVTVRSLNGPAVTIIQGAGTNYESMTVRCAYMADGAVLDGFTLTGGATAILTADSDPRGGGVRCASTNATLTNCVVTGNQTSVGGGVYGGTLYRCTLSNNLADLGGGAAASVLIGCAVTSNSGSSGGGGVFGGTLNNCVLTGNSALYGGAVYSEPDDGYATILNNCTLTGNLATRGGAVAGATLNNCIVYYNAADNDPNYSSDFVCTFAYSCTTPLPPGPGNLDAEPLLASGTHLSAQSPCIGGGNAAYASGVDIDGEPWQSPPCIGADQFVPGQSTNALTVGIGAGYTNVSVGFAVPFQALIDGRLTASFWDFGDAVVVSNRPFASHVWTAPGTYVVQLSGYNDSHPSGVSAAVVVQIATREVYYVNGTNATPAPPYTNWAGAATNIQDAIDAGTQIGRLVLVADGLYTQGSRAVYGLGTNVVVVPEGVELRSVHGPAVTTIVGVTYQAGLNGNGFRCVYVGTNAVLSGFTLTNGQPQSGPGLDERGGGAWCEQSALVTNCILSRNSTTYYGGGTYGGTVNNCTFTNNYAFSIGGGAYDGTLNDCLLIGNSGSGAASCTVNNSTFLGNSGPSGGGAADCTLTHCTLTGNSSMPGIYGGISIGGGVIGGILNDCLLSGNSASLGSAAADATLNNCTVAGNLVALSGGAVFQGTLNNCIIYFNSGDNYTNSTFNYCCTTPLPQSGAGNIDLDPQFINLAGGDLHLQSSSPCIDAGNSLIVTDPTDLDGNPRITGNTVDMGAYELQAPAPPSINLQPASQTVYAGNVVSFTVGASGSLSLSWQWWLGKAPLLNATNSTLTLSSVTTNQAGGYSVVVTNSLGSVTSLVAILTVLDAAPAITLQPRSQVVLPGYNVAFPVRATGSLPLYWQWYRNGSALKDATDSSLTLAGVATNQAGGYFVVITNSLGATTSQVAVLTVLPGPPPAITLQPLSQTVLAGGTVTFTAGATGFPPLSWQWLFKGTAIPGATNSSLTLTAATIDQAGPYSVLLSNAVGSASSDNATLTVLVPGTKYVRQDSPSPAPPYASWSTAAHSIQEAVDAAVPGDEIFVTNGLYAIGGRTAAGSIQTNRVIVDKAVLVRSANGPGVTVIQGYQIPGLTNGFGSVRCAYLAGGAVLSGFTLTGGTTRDSSSISNDLNGAGAYCASTNATLTNCIVTGNRAEQRGGGVEGGTLQNCTLSNNWATLGGAEADSVLVFCTVIGNSAANGGGAAGGTLNDCILRGNSASSQGGGAYGGALNNCVLVANSALQGGGVFSDPSRAAAALNNCTLTANLANEGGGVYGGTLNNCIVYYNSAANGSNYNASEFTCAFAYSCTTPLPPGPGNFQGEPLLASVSHLSAQSPCVGRGSAAYAGGVDIDGEPWQNPPCIGADQLVAGQTLGPLTVAIQAGYTNVGTSFAVPFQALIDGQLTASAWDFGDSVVVSNHPYASHAWTAPGSYVVRLTGYNDSYPGGVTATVQVQVTPKETYYVNGASSSPTPPYTNWATAAMNIQDAIDAGTQIGRLVLVADGLYTNGARAVYGLGTNRVVVMEGVELRSVNGPAVTIIAGAGPNGTSPDWSLRCAYVGTNAILNGFTLTNGYAKLQYNDPASPGGGGWCERSGVVTNCVLIWNQGTYGGGASGGTLLNCFFGTNYAEYGGGAYLSTVIDCVLAGNTGAGGGAANCTLNHCGLLDNVAEGLGGGGAYSSTLNNCILTSNTATLFAYGGGGVYGGILNDCILSGNSASFESTGGAAYGATLNNCTITGNSSGLGGGVVESVLNNCILYFNDEPNYDTASTLSDCCTSPMPTNGVGNITNTPLFVNQSGGDFHLQANSPCINAGNNAFVYGTTDLDGNPRIVGGTVDIGAYEFQAPRSVISYAWLQYYGLPTDGSADYADPDGDGMNNWQEWICGTNPTNALSVLRLISAAPTSGNAIVSWQSVAGIDYFLKRNTGLSTPFSLLATNIVGLPGITTYADTNAIGTGPFFYRVGVQGP